jgi:hypothetical protein
MITASLPPSRLTLISGLRARLATKRASAPLQEKGRPR